MWNLKNKTNEQRKRDKPRNKQTLNCREQTDGHQRGGGGVGWKTGEGVLECIYHDEHWVIYRSVGLLYCTSETNKTLNIKYTRLKIQGEKEPGLDDLENS